LAGERNVDFEMSKNSREYNRQYYLDNSKAIMKSRAIRYMIDIKYRESINRLKKFRSKLKTFAVRIERSKHG
jgi:hypothetical protein